MSEVVERDPIDPSVAVICDERLQEARTHMAAACWNWVEAGKRFAANKADLKGQWVKWCETRGVSRPSADTLIRIADRFGELTLGINSDPIQIDYKALGSVDKPAVSSGWPG
jgi:hypothetical protein